VLSVQGPQGSNPFAAFALTDAGMGVLLILLWLNRLPYAECLWWVAMMTPTIATMGYEGTTIEAFVAALKRFSIDLVIDVQDIPLSRKKGFSKNQFAEVLRASGIEYLHLRGLGDPKEGREAARAGNYPLFERIFNAHMRSQPALRDLALAAARVTVQRVCLMCFESDPTKCHRSLVAAHLARITGLAIRTLAVHGHLFGTIAA